MCVQRRIGLVRDPPSLHDYQRVTQSRNPLVFIEFLTNWLCFAFSASARWTSPWWVRSVGPSGCRHRQLASAENTLTAQATPLFSLAGHQSGFVFSSGGQLCGSAEFFSLLGLRTASTRRSSRFVFANSTNGRLGSSGVSRRVAATSQEDLGSPAAECSLPAAYKRSCRSEAVQNTRTSARRDR